MPIESHHGTTVITGANSTEWASFKALRGAFELEVRTGIKMSSSYVTSNVVRARIGSKTTRKHKLLAELDRYIAERWPTRESVQ